LLLLRENQCYDVTVTSKLFEILYSFTCYCCRVCRPTDRFEYDIQGDYELVTHSGSCCCLLGYDTVCSGTWVPKLRLSMRHRSSLLPWRWS
jgi:hypothetical protein